MAEDRHTGGAGIVSNLNFQDTKMVKPNNN